MENVKCSSDLKEMNMCKHQVHFLWDLVMAIRKNENDTWEFLRDLTILSQRPQPLALDLSFQKLFEGIIFSFAKHTMSQHGFWFFLPNEYSNFLIYTRIVEMASENVIQLI